MYRCSLGASVPALTLSSREQSHLESVSLPLGPHGCCCAGGSTSSSAHVRLVLSMSVQDCAQIVDMGIHSGHVTQGPGRDTMEASTLPGPAETGTGDPVSCPPSGVQSLDLAPERASL